MIQRLRKMLMLKQTNKFLRKQFRAVEKNKYARRLYRIFFSKSGANSPRQFRLDKKRRSLFKVELDKIELGNFNPKISIIMPTYNRSALISRAIESVLRQSYRNFELIIIDDGSIDGTRSVVESYSDKRIIYLHQENKGVSAARNNGLKSATGDYIAYLDSDNEWGKTYLEYTLKSTKKLGKKCIYSILTIVDDTGSVTSYRAADFDSASLWDRNFIDLNVFFHEANLDAPILFDTRLRRAVDWDYIVRVTQKQECELAYFDECRYSDSTDNSRLTLSAPSLYTKIVRAKNHFYSNDEIDILRLSRLAVGIVISAPAAERARWGDYYYARSLQKYLIRLGYGADLIYADSTQAARQKFDVNIVIRGRRREKHQAHQLNILWVISHPETVSVEECAEYDHVFTASNYHEALLRLEGVDRVSTLLQASDPELFNTPSNPNRDGTVFVGRTKGVDRRFVVDVVKNLKDVHVIGDGWENFISPDKIEAQWVQYQQLPEVYRSKNVVLAEHWRSMRLFGIVANRVSDANGCGARVLSDKVRGDERLQGYYYKSCRSAEEAITILDNWRTEDGTNTGNAFVSMQEQAKAIDKIIASLVFRHQTQIDAHSARAKRLKIFKGSDWREIDWFLINRLMPQLDSQSMTELDVSYGASDGLSYFELNDVPTAVDDLREQITGKPQQSAAGIEYLDEKIWRLFSVGKHRPANSSIATVISPSVETALSEFQQLVRNSGQVRIWDPYFTCRVVLKNGVVHNRMDFADTARGRVRRYLLDAESWVTAIASNVPNSEFYRHVSLATGTYVLNDTKHEAHTILHDPHWKIYNLSSPSELATTAKSAQGQSEKIRSQYWAHFADALVH